MNLETDLANVHVIEFGVGRDGAGDTEFVAVPVDQSVQAILRTMAVGTWDAMDELPDPTAIYEPSEKYASTELVTMPLSSDLADGIRELHEAQNLPLDTRALDGVSSIFCYFARITDANGSRLTAVHRSTQFKLVANNNRLVRMFDDSLRVLEERVFKLDVDFDVIVDNGVVYILHPTGFEFLARIQAAILAAVPTNVDALKALLPNVDFGPLATYAATRPRAARYLASIRSQPGNVDIGALQQLCASTGVPVTEGGGILTVSAGSEMAFLEVLDRRRYPIELVTGAPEQFRAASRSRING